jgi:hypothetical protein
MRRRNCDPGEGRNGWEDKSMLREKGNDSMLVGRSFTVRCVKNFLFEDGGVTVHEMC